MLMQFPTFCLILLIGPNQSGKTTFAQKHFDLANIVSAAPSLIADRLHLQQLTVIDSNNLDKDEREALKVIAKKNHCPVYVVLFNTQAEQQSIIKKLASSLKHEKLAALYLLNSFIEIDQVKCELFKLDIDKTDMNGPFDIIGDIHGCYSELCELLIALGYEVNDNLVHSNQPAVTTTLQRKVIFVGDLVDRGPNSIGVLALVMNMVKHGLALCIAGNHEIKLASLLKGKKVTISHGLDTTAKEFENASNEFKQSVITFIESLPIYYVLDNHNLVVAHAGMKEFYQGRMSPRIKSFSLFGDTSNHLDDQGNPIRQDWAQHYQGAAMVVYGHTPVTDLKWVNHTICIDTSCVFGGRLTALRYPEKETVSIPAKEQYYTY